MNLVISILTESWRLLAESSVYIMGGLLAAGLLRVFLNPAAVVRHFGQGRISSVFKAAFLGIPIPLCSCGVLPAAVSLKKQGATNGAVTAFMISTPESGVDSIALTYALLDPVMTVSRPLAAFTAASAAGVAENLVGKGSTEKPIEPDLTCPVDRCCTGIGCPPDVHAHHHTLFEKMRAGVRFALTDVWGDMAGWFFVGLLLAGVITSLAPPDFMARHFGGGISSMLLMLVVGIPLYICATASTPVAAALILQGVSPGAALVFLLAGPATNITSLTVLFGVLGRRATFIYLTAISVFAVAFGLAVDAFYSTAGISARAAAGRAAEIVPEWAGIMGGLALVALSVKPVWRGLKARIGGASSAGRADACCSAGAHDGGSCGLPEEHDHSSGAPAPG